MTTARQSANFLDLALDDYRASRLLLRSGMLSQGVVLAATAVEKHLKAVLALKKLFTKKHLDSGLFQAIQSLHPELHAMLDPDFMKFLKRGFQLRYASAESDGYSIVINQHRTLIALDNTIDFIDKGFLVKKGDVEIDTPLRRAVLNNDRAILDDNVAQGGITFSDLAARRNKVFELRVDHKLATIQAQYETEGVNIVGDFCKKPDISAAKSQWKLTLG
jgi:HEPN domain-containing protein